MCWHFCLLSLLKKIQCEVIKWIFKRVLRGQHRDKNVEVRSLINLRIPESSKPTPAPLSSTQSISRATLTWLKRSYQEEFPSPPSHHHAWWKKRKRNSSSLRLIFPSPQRHFSFHLPSHSIFLLLKDHIRTYHLVLIRLLKRESNTRKRKTKHRIHKLHFTHIVIMLFNVRMALRKQGWQMESIKVWRDMHECAPCGNTHVGSPSNAFFRSQPLRREEFLLRQFVTAPRLTSNAQGGNRIR